ncbi:MAG: glycosyltransferase family 4 protein [Lachnospiraceae bacterium]|nr:glycosyltransferase family 4 protein [Lachnospiraceae bacterium]
MAKILILANSSVGAYNFRNKLLERLLKMHEVFISVPDTNKTAELEVEGCEVVNTPINRRGMNPIEDFQLFWAYSKLIKRIKPDLVLTYTIKPNIYGGLCCRLKKIPYVTTITGLGTSFQKQGFLKQMIIRMHRVSLKKAKCVFFQNEQNRQIFAEYRIGGKKSILVNGSGVELNWHTFEEYPSGGHTRFLFIGRIMKEKGIEEFLKAAEALHTKYGEKVSFEILGRYDEDYHYQERLTDYEKRGIVSLSGFQTDVHPYIKAASAIVLPTYHEGMSNVLMEASASGRPVVASDISGCREIFEEGVTGFGCKPQDAESLITAMEKLMALKPEERAVMGRRAREKMEREFDRKLVTDVYIREIEGILQSR